MSDDKMAFELRLDDRPQPELRTYQPWRERYAAPIIRRPNPFIAAADQVMRYGRQLSNIDWNLRMSAAVEQGGNIDAEIFQRSGYMAVWEAYENFIAQFDGNVREVLTRTFWQAYHA